MREIIDGSWIKSRLTHRRGEKAALARAMGIGTDKLSKIISGDRHVQPAELPGLLAFFEAEPATSPGLAESLRPFEAKDDDIQALNRLLMRPARHPVTYILCHSSPAMDLRKGDLLIIDLGSTATAGDLVVATEQDNVTQDTFVARWVDPWLLRGEGDQAPRQVDDSQRLAILGPVVGVMRGAKS